MTHLDWLIYLSEANQDQRLPTPVQHRNNYQTSIFTWSTLPYEKFWFSMTNQRVAIIPIIRKLFMVLNRKIIKIELYPSLIYDVIRNNKVSLIKRVHSFKTDTDRVFGLMFFFTLLCYLKISEIYWGRGDCFSIWWNYTNLSSYIAERMPFINNESFDWCNQRRCSCPFHVQVSWWGVREMVNGDLEG